MVSITMIREWFQFRERQPLFLLVLIYSNSLAAVMLSVLVTFLTDIWKLNLKRAVVIMNLQGGAALLMEMPVASLADACLGRYWMLFITSILYSIGLGLLTVSVPQFVFKGVKSCPAGEKTCASKLNASPFYWALVLIVVAKAGHRICLKPLTYDKIKDIKIPKNQLQEKRINCGCFRYKIKVVPKEKRDPKKCQKTVIRFMCNIAGFAGGFTAVIGFLSFGLAWSHRFMISAGVMATGTFICLLGRPFHPPPQLRGSTLTNMLRVLLAAMLKRPPRDGERNIEYNHGNEDHARQDHDPTMTPTPRMRCLNNAAISGNVKFIPKEWSNCTVRHVEETKLILTMVPISATFLFYGMVKSNSDTFFTEQANATDRTFGIILSKFPIQIFFMLAGLARYIIKFLYRIIFESRMRQMNGGYSDRLKIGLGMLAALACCSIASVVEKKRLRALREHGLLNNPDAIAPMSVFWLTPQFVLIGIMDGLARDGMVDFYKHQVPSSMRRYGDVFIDVVIGLGKILNAVFVTILDMVVIKLYGEDASWFADFVNGSRLDYFYRAFVVMSMLNLFIYAYIATFIHYPEVTAETGEDEEYDEEEAE